MMRIIQKPISFYVIDTANGKARYELSLITSNLKGFGRNIFDGNIDLTANL